MAYWYPEPYWGPDAADLVKSLLPFFDSVAILLPTYMYGRHRDSNEWLAGPLEDRGLLHVLQPESFVDQTMTEQLWEILSELLDAGIFDELDTSDRRYGYHELSRSRLGWDADVELSGDLITELQKRRLARSSRDGVSIPLHPVVRTTVLVLLSQLAPRRGTGLGLELHPVTPSRDRIADLLTVLRLPGMPSAADVIGADTEVVGLDLSGVPLEDVLAFREAHGSECRSYIRSVRAFVRDMSLLESEEREVALLDRREELADLASGLRRQSRSYWRAPLARLSLGGVGAAISLAEGNPVPAVLAGIVAILEWEPREDFGGAFSYLFELDRAIGS